MVKDSLIAGIAAWFISLALLGVIAAASGAGTAPPQQERRLVASASAVDRPKPAPDPAFAPEIQVEPDEPKSVFPPPVGSVLKEGVLIVISKSSQNMHVFKDGALWASSPVSTGKQGKETPSGAFPILQKREFHRSNLYSNAPMPHMQRLTWDGIAIHAGRLPGYPASHGCIRIPHHFARKLFGLTDMARTTVVVTGQQSTDEQRALKLAMNMPLPLPGAGGGLVQRPENPLPQYISREPPPMLAQSGQEGPLPQSAAEGKPPVQIESLTDGEIIQLAAAPSTGEAEAYWSGLVARHPDLRTMQKAVIPASVNGQQVYRLRASGPDARATCSALQAAGTACFPVS